MAAGRARVGQGMRVCDIGSGYGATAGMLVEKFGAEVTAMTISPAQHAFASARCGDAANPRHLLGDWLRNELPDAFFDAALAIESSEHMTDKATFFAQAHRVLRPGGRLVVCAWLSADAPNARTRRWLLEPICRAGRMAQMRTFSDYERLAETAGFAVESAEDRSREVARTWPVIVRTFALKLLRQPGYARYLFNAHARNRVFALTILRIHLAYRTGAMRYGVFTLRKKPAG
jgi:tocopherol O-methyltransferase